MAYRASVVSPGSTSISVLVDDHRGHLEVGLRGAPSGSRRRACRSTPARGRRWRRAAGPGRCAGPRASARPARRTASGWPGAGSPGVRRRLSRPWARGQRRDLDLEVAGRLDQAGQPPAGLELVGRERAWSCRVTGTVPPSTRTLHFLQVPWPPQVESIAMPFHVAESKTVTPGRHPDPALGRRASGPGRSTVNASSTRPVPSWVAGPAPDGSIRPFAADVGDREVRAVGHRCPVMRLSRPRAACRGPVRGDPGAAPLVVAEQQVGGLDRLDDLRACGCP